MNQCKVEYDDTHAARGKLSRVCGRLQAKRSQTNLGRILCRVLLPVDAALAEPLKHWQSGVTAKLWLLHSHPSPHPSYK